MENQPKNRIEIISVSTYLKDSVLINNKGCLTCGVRTSSLIGNIQGSIKTPILNLMVIRNRYQYCNSKIKFCTSPFKWHLWSLESVSRLVAPPNECPIKATSLRSSLPRNFCRQETSSLFPSPSDAGASSLASVATFFTGFPSSIFTIKSIMRLTSHALQWTCSFRISYSSSSLPVASSIQMVKRHKTVTKVAFFRVREVLSKELVRRA